MAALRNNGQLDALLGNLNSIGGRTAQQREWDALSWFWRCPGDKPPVAPWRMPYLPDSLQHLISPVPKFPPAHRAARLMPQSQLPAGQVRPGVPANRRPTKRQTPNMNIPTKAMRRRSPPAPGRMPIGKRSASPQPRRGTKTRNPMLKTAATGAQKRNLSPQLGATLKPTSRPRAMGVSKPEAPPIDIKGLTAAEVCVLKPLGLAKLLQRRLKQPGPITSSTILRKAVSGKQLMDFDDESQLLGLGIGMTDARRLIAMVEALKRQDSAKVRRIEETNKNKKGEKPAYLAAALKLQAKKQRRQVGSQSSSIASNRKPKPKLRTSALDKLRGPKPSVLTRKRKESPTTLTRKRKEPNKLSKAVRNTTNIANTQSPAKRSRVSEKDGKEAKNMEEEDPDEYDPSAEVVWFDESGSDASGLSPGIVDDESIEDSSSDDEKKHEDDEIAALVAEEMEYEEEQRKRRAQMKKTTEVTHIDYPWKINDKCETLIDGDWRPASIIKIKSGYPYVKVKDMLGNLFNQRLRVSTETYRTRMEISKNSPTHSSAEPTSDSVASGSSKRLEKRGQKIAQKGSAQAAAARAQYATSSRIAKPQRDHRSLKKSRSDTDKVDAREAQLDQLVGNAKFFLLVKKIVKAGSSAITRRDVRRKLEKTLGLDTGTLDNRKKKINEHIEKALKQIA
ncbi:hypothetical protein AAMO2058_000172800 [Amorphochlora amoebiformis]